MTAFLCSCITLDRNFVVTCCLYRQVINVGVSTSTQISHLEHGGRTLFQIAGNTFKTFRRLVKEMAVISVTNTAKAWKHHHHVHEGLGVLPVP
jgi:hypothetical protein